MRKYILSAAVILSGFVYAEQAEREKNNIPCADLIELGSPKYANQKNDLFFFGKKSETWDTQLSIDVYFASEKCIRDIRGSSDPEINVDLMQMQTQWGASRVSDIVNRNKSGVKSYVLQREIREEDVAKLEEMIQQEKERKKKVQEEGEAEKEKIAKLKEKAELDKIVAEKAAQSKQQELLATCKKTKEYEFYEAQDAVLIAYQNHQYALDELKQQRKYERESGVRDLYTVRKLGEMAVEQKELTATLWKQYKSKGGKESSPAKIKPLSDPCEALEKQASQGQ